MGEVLWRPPLHGTTAIERFLEATGHRTYDELWPTSGEASSRVLRTGSSWGIHTPSDPFIVDDAGALAHTVSLG
jgi:hypothetical protein